MTRTRRAPEGTLYTTHDTPVGRLTLQARGDGGGLTSIEFPDPRHPRPVPEGAVEARAPFAEALRQLDAYFAGTLREFDLELAPSGTPFQLEVWRALRAIPYGATRSYLDVAKAIGRPSACRAVGAANGRNPLPIVVPCHRVIGAGGDLTGFGGGLDVKRKLLELEGALRQPSGSPAALTGTTV